MRKILLYAFLITLFMININVKAQYKSYETGDVVVINGQYFVVIEDSDSNNDKLRLLSRDIAISNEDELSETCSYLEERSSSDDGVIQCYTDHAVLCNLDNSNNRNCNLIVLPFEERSLEEEEQLVYDENSNTNIGYFLKNKVEPYYKEALDLNYLKISLFTSDEQINYIRKFDTDAADNLVDEYSHACETHLSLPTNNMRSQSFGSSSGSVVGKEDSFDYIYDDFMINSLKYTSTCGKYVGYTNSNGGVSYDFYDSYNYIRPVLEVSKTEFEHEISKEVEGNGSLDVNVGKDISYSAGDYFSIGGKEFIVLGAKNNQLRLMPISPLGITNMEEVSQSCSFTSSNPPGGMEKRGDTSDTPDTLEEAIACFRQHMDICMSNVPMLGNPYYYPNMTDSAGCSVMMFPYNFDDLENISFNPEKETNIGYLLNHNVKEELQESLGVNIINVDLIKAEEIHILELLMGSMIYNDDFPGNLRASSSSRSATTINPIKSSRFGLINYNSVLNLIDTGSMPLEDYVYPVITISINDMNQYTKTGNTVTITTEPDEGYELVDLKVTDENNNSIIFNPTALVRQGQGTYTFTMPDVDAHVYAKYMKVDRFDAKSLSEELTIIDGLNHISGEIVRFQVSLNENDTLEKIVYYDGNDNEIEIPYEENNGEYTFTMPNNNVFLRAVINYYKPVYNLIGRDVTIPVQKSEEGGVLTFTIDGTKVVRKITFKNEQGNEIFPYYSVNNGTYSVIMPAYDVFVSIDYSESEAMGDASNPEEEQNIDKVPITGDNINNSIYSLIVSVITLAFSVIFIKKINKKKKKVLIPYDMV